MNILALIVSLFLMDVSWSVIIKKPFYYASPGVRFWVGRIPLMVFAFSSLIIFWLFPDNKDQAIITYSIISIILYFASLTVLYTQND